MRFVTTWSARAFALASAVALGVVMLAAVVVGLREPPVPAGSFEARDFGLAFNASAVWSAAFAALSLFFLFVVLERIPENALGPDPEVRTFAQLGGYLAGAGAGLGWGLLPAAMLSPVWRTPLVVLVIVGLILVPAVGIGLSVSAYRREVEEFEPPQEETRTITPSRRITPSETARVSSQSRSAERPR